MGPEAIIIIIALILSIVLHEAAHGYAANWLGDPTARLAGRLSLNPLVHIDLLGSVIVPALLFISSVGFIFGWAKPVPYNPHNLRDQKWGDAIVAIAGPATNILLALIFSVIIRFAPLSPAMLELSSYIVYLNILLAFFNMIPIPPLDGSKVLLSLLPPSAALSYRNFMSMTERFGLLFTFLFIFLFINIFWAPFSQIILSVYTLFTGLGGLY